MKTISFNQLTGIEKAYRVIGYTAATFILWCATSALMTFLGGLISLTK